MLLNVEFNVLHHRIPVNFNVLHHRIPVVFKNLYTVAMPTEADPYMGDYEITPKVEAQKMDTKGKLMLEDVTVKEIPCFDVSNASGGTTFYIATMDKNPSGGVAVLGKAKLGYMIL